MQEAQAPAMPASAAAAKAQIEAMVDRLAQRLKQQPDDVQGWLMLARSHVVLARYAEAVDAYRKADALRPNEPAILVDMAYAVAMAQGRNLQGEPLALIQRAQGIEPAGAP
jgi:cytochrome c-type biogenesis protein CcmH